VILGRAFHAPGTWADRLFALAVALERAQGEAGAGLLIKLSTLLKPFVAHAAPAANGSTCASGRDGHAEVGEALAGREAAMLPRLSASSPAGCPLRFGAFAIGARQQLHETGNSGEQRVAVRLEIVDGDARTAENAGAGRDLRAAPVTGSIRHAASEATWRSISQPGRGTLLPAKLAVAELTQRNGHGVNSDLIG
jgi:hypothetical protein